MVSDPIKTTVLEALVERFESAWDSDQPIAIESLIRPIDGDARRDTLVELIRTEMELRFQQGERPTTESFLQRFPELANDPTATNEIAFEEYRQHHLTGNSVGRDVFADRYRISTDEWPEWAPHEPTVPGTLPGGAEHPQKECAVPQIGQRWHGFDIVAELGRGAFGSVFLAKQDSLAGRLVVLKFSSIVSDEPQFLARLQHTNIVPVYSVHQTESQMSICMPFLGVATLADVTRHVRSHTESSRHPPLDSQQLISTVAQHRQETVERDLDDPVVREAFRKRGLVHRTPGTTNLSLDRWIVETMVRVLEGLGYAHSRGIVHGDLKPANILLSDDGEPIILDFHLAKLEGRQWSSHVGGTIPYMAPEHLRSMLDSTPFDARADLFSAGIILHELLTGEVDASDPTSTAFDQFPGLIADREQRIRSFRPNSSLHPDLQSIIAHSTAFEPGQRYQNADQMRDDLQRYLTDRPLAVAPNRSWSIRFGKWIRRHPRLTSAASVAAMATALLALAATVIWTNWNRARRSEAIQIHQQRLVDLQQARIPLTAGRLIGLEPGDAALDRGERLLAQLESKATTATSQHPPSLNDFRFLSAADQRQERFAIAEVHFWLAEALREQAVRSESSTALLETALQHNRLARRWSDGRGTQLQYAEILDQLGRADEARRARAVGESLPNQSRLDRYLTAYLAGRDYRQSSDKLLALIESDPMDVAAWLMLGHVHGAHRKFADAEACYTVAIGLSPDQAYPWMFRGAVRLESGRYPEALEDFDQAIQREPNLVPAYLNRALALMRMRRWKDARAAFDQALELGARATRIYYLRAQVRRQLGDDAGADRDMETFRKTRPNDPLSWIVLGNLHIDQDPQLAVENYRHALEIHPDSLDALNNLAHVFAERLQDNQAAITVLDRAVELDPKNPRRYCDRGVIRARLGDRSGALADARQALTLRRDAEVFYRVSGIYAQTSRESPTDANQALNCLAAAIARNPAWVAGKVDDDRDLEPLRQLERFREITQPLAEIMKHARPGG